MRHYPSSMDQNFHQFMTRSVLPPLTSKAKCTQVANQFVFLDLKHNQLLASIPSSFHSQLIN